jgi:ribonuclease BN (tRNA processing enzyme)
VELTIVGCSGSVSGRDTPASCYLVQAPHRGRTFSLLLDLGPGAFGALYDHVVPSEVDAIGFSHLHPDHCLDLCAYYVASKYSPSAPWPRIPVHGPTGTASRLARAYEVPVPTGGVQQEPGPGIGEHFRYHDWQPEQQIGPFDVRTTRVTERASGAVIAYSGDTGPCQALADLAAGVDLLLVEAAFQHRPELPAGIHLSARQAAEIGSAAGVGRVVLTHIPPWFSRQDALVEARSVATVDVQVAEPGARLPVG